MQEWVDGKYRKSIHDYKQGSAGNMWAALGKLRMYSEG